MNTLNILKIRKIFVRKDVTLLLSFSILSLVIFSSCDYAKVVANNEVQQAQPVDGKTLYQGIFFGEGPIASKIPELQDTFNQLSSLDKTQQIAMRKFVDNLMIAIDKTNSNFFDSFAEAMQSGDHLRIKKMLKRTSQISVKALDQIPAVKNWRS